METLDLDTLTLREGAHPSPDAGVCLLEAVAFFAGEPHSDSPECVDVTLARFGRAWNDGMRDDDERRQLVPYVAALVGTAGTAGDAGRRAWMALDWSVRVSTPAWLELAGLVSHADRLRELPQVVAPTSEALEALGAVEAAVEAAAGVAARGAVEAAVTSAAEAAAVSAARAATRAAARATARAATWTPAEAAAVSAAWDAAWDAAGDAAWDAVTSASRAAVVSAARAAARAAAWDAAWDAARATARATAWTPAEAAAVSAAWDAAGDAAEAATRAAAGVAAGERLDLTVTALQASAHRLYLDMIEYGPHDPAALAVARETVLGGA